MRLFLLAPRPKSRRHHTGMRLFLLAPRPKSRRHHINKGWAWFEAKDRSTNFPWSFYYPGQKNRYSRDIHEIDLQCDHVISRDIDFDLQCELATRSYRESRRCRTEARYRTMSHDRTVDQPHEFFGCNDFFGQGSSIAACIAMFLRTTHLQVINVNLACVIPVKSLNSLVNCGRFVMHFAEGSFQGDEDGKKNCSNSPEAAGGPFLACPPKEKQRYLCKAIVLCRSALEAAHSGSVSD